MFNKKLKPICKNCALFNPKESNCRVIILHEGERINIPVEADDPCFFKNEFIALNEKMEKETFQPEIEQVRLWVEDPDTGEQTDKKGIVKIQYPKDFFGKES